MRVSYTKQRHAIWQKEINISFLLPIFILLASVIAVLMLAITPASAATSSTLNFQGRLMSNTGGLVPDGSYNIEFKIYDDPSVGTNYWTENRTGGSAVTVKNGYFSVYLGEVTPFGSVPWDQELWMTMNVNADGEMSPRFKLTAVPYAFRAGAVTDSAGNAYTGDDLIQKSPSTIQAVNSALAAIRLNQTGSGSILQLQGDGTDVFTVDKAGAAVLGSSIRIGNTVTAVTGAIRWTGTDFEGYDGTDWVSLTNANLPPAGDYISQTINNNSTASAAVYNVFQQSNYPSFSTTQNAASGIVYTQADGRFTVPTDGTYNILSTLQLEHSANNLVTLIVRVNGVNVYSHDVYVHATVDPVERTTTLIRELTAGDYVEVYVDGINNITVHGGSSLTIVPVSRASTGGGGGSGTSFEQNGNNFGVTAILGTTDNQGLTFITNNTDALTITNAGNATFANGLAIASGGLDIAGNLLLDGDITDSNALTISSGGGGDLTLDSSNGLAFIADSNSALTISNTGLATFTNALTISGGGLDISGDITGTTGLTISSGGGGDLTLDSASDILQLSDATIRRVASGTTVIDLADVGTTTLEISNSGASQVAGLTVEGDVVGASFTGVGTGLTDLNGAEITSGIIPDARLSANVVLADNDQTFSGINTFSQGLVLGNSTSTTPGTIRWSGTDFEGYDGIQWASLTSGGGGSGPLSVAFIQAYDNTGGTDLNTGTPTAVPWDNETKKDTGFTHDNVTDNTRIYLDDAGWYKISYNVSGINQSSNRNTVFCQVRLNGATYNSPSGSYSYTRDTTNAEATNTASVYIETTSTNEYYEVMCSQAGTAGAQLSEAGRSWTVAEKVTSTGSGSGLSFDQDGNSFGGTAILGTTDNNGLNFITNNTTALSLTTSNQAIFAGEILANGGLTLNGDTFSDLTGTGLSNVGGLLSLDTTSASGAFVNNGNAFAGLAILGTTDNNDLSFITDGAERARFTNNGELVIGGTTPRGGELVDINGTLRSNKYILGTGPDLSLIPIVGGQSVASSWWGLQLVGNRQANVDYTPTNIGAAGAFSVAIPNQQAASIGLLVVGQTGQSADLIRLTDSSNNTLSAFDSNGQLILGRSSGLNGNVTFNNSSNTNTAVLGSVATTANRTINLPDESGTICLSGSASCTFLTYATGSFVTEASTNDIIAINKTGASGNLIALQKNGGAVFTVANTGALQIQSTDSAALDIRNVGGTSYFSIDTSSGQVQVGSSTADAVGVLFVLDTKNTAGDPTGTDGGIYYNSSTGKFRCYEDGTWKDCIGTRQIRSFIDTTTDAVVDNNTTNYWDTAVENNNSFPNLTPSTVNKVITASVVIEVLESGSTADRIVQSRIERGIGAPPTCGSGTVVGPILSNFTTNNNQNDTTTVVFVDEPATTSTVYYTVCSDSATSSAANMSVTRLRFTLEEANNSN